MSVGTVTESSRNNEKLVLLSTIGETDDPFSFLRDSTYVAETSTIKSMSTMTKVEERLKEIEEDIIPVQTNFSLFNWISPGPLFTKRERVYPTLIDIKTKRELYNFLDTNRYSYTPDTDKLKDYQFVSQETSSSVIESLKDVNDKIESFRRCFNRAVKADDEQYHHEKRIKDLLDSGDISGDFLIKSSAIFVNKKTRTLKKFFDDVGNTTMYNENTSAYDHFNNVNSMYKFIHFTLGSVVYKSAKTWVVSSIITSMGLAGGGALLGSIPIYIAFSAYDIYKSIDPDAGETQIDKIIYTLWKSPLVGCMDCIKDLATTHLSIGRGFIISGSLVFDTTMMFIDPRLSKQRADDLAKTYSQTMDKETIKNLITPTQEALTVSRILSKAILPLDWVANLPEAVFTSIYSKVETITSYTGPLKYLYPAAIPAMYIIKKTSLMCNITWKFGVYAIPAVFCIVTCYNSFANVMPYFRDFFKMFIERSEGGNIGEFGYGLPLKSTLSSMVDRLTDVTPLSWDKIHQSIIGSIPGLGIMENVIITMLGYIKITTPDIVPYEFAKKVFLKLYADKQIARFFLGIPVNWLTNTTTGYLKSHTQMYLSVIAPTLLTIYSGRFGTITSLDQYLSIAKKSLSVGAGGFLISSLVNMIWDNMLDHSKNPKMVAKYREIDVKSERLSGRWLSKRAVKNILYTYHYLSSNLIVDWIDTSVNKIKQKVAGSQIEWIEVGYGRKNFIYESNFTWLSNRLVMDEYFSQAMNSAMIDVISNIDIINKLDQEANNYKEIKLDKEKIKRVIEERKEIDLKNREKEIKNQEIFSDEKNNLESKSKNINQKLTINKTKLDDISIRLQTIDSSETNALNKLLETQRIHDAERVKIEHNLSLTLKALDDTKHKIELSESKVVQIDFIQKYYSKNENLWDNASTEMSKENVTYQTASIVLNKFIPFIEKSDPQMLAALEIDARTHYNIVHNRMKEYIENISLLEASSKKILLNNESDISTKLENINTRYNDVVQRFNKDDGLRNHIEYMQAINEIIIKKQSLEMALGGYDIESFYQSNKRLSSIKKTGAVIIDDISKFSTGYIVDPSLIEKIKIGEGVYEETLDQGIDKLLDDYRRRNRKGGEDGKKMVDNKGWLSSIYGYFENYTVEQIRNGMRNIVGYGTMKKRESVKRLQELKKMEENGVPKSELKIYRDRELRSIQTIDSLMEREISRIQIAIPSMKPVSEEDKQFVKIISDVSISHRVDRQVDIGIDVDIDTIIDTTTDYEMIYETAFGGDQFPTSYTGEELQEMQSFDKIMNLTSGVKVVSDSFRMHEYECTTPPSLSCLNHNLFVKSIPIEVLKEMDNINDEIYKKISNLGIEGTTREKKSTISNNMMLMWITPEYRDRLSKFKMSEKTKTHLGVIMRESTTVVNSGRMFDEYLKDKEVDWANPHVLYLLSKKMYHMDYVSEILLNSNLKEYIKKEDQLFKRKDSLFEEETKQHEKLHQMATGELFSGIKIRDEPSTKETWSEMIPNYISNLIGSIFGSIGATGITKGVDWIRTKINSSRDQREKDKIRVEYLSKLDGVDNLILRDSLKTQIDIWYTAASKVDSITETIKYEKNLMSLNYQTEDKSLRYVQRTMEGSDMSGILSPSEDEILDMFFVDDDTGLKRKYVTESGLSFPGRVLEIEKKVRMVKELV